MLRFIRLFFILVVYSAFVFWIVDRAGYKMQLGSFIDGLIVAGLTGFTFFWIDGWWSTVTKPFRPMVVKLETKETPAQINRAMLFAVAKGILVIGGFIVAIVIIMSNS